MKKKDERNEEMNEKNNQNEKEIDVEVVKNKKNGKKQENKNEEKSAEKIEKLEKEIEELKETLMRRAAEFENYKRRTENDQMNIIKYAAESFIVNMLPVFDDLERTVKHMEESDDLEALRKGVRMVYDKFSKTLEEQGVKKIDAKGKPFDFNYHEALMQQPAEGVEPHTVLEEIEPGYLFKDKVIRHAKVIVSQEVAGETKNESNNSADEKE